MQLLDEARQHPRLELARLGHAELPRAVLLDEAHQADGGRRAGGGPVREEALVAVEAGPVRRRASLRGLHDARGECVHEVEDRWE